MEFEQKREKLADGLMTAGASVMLVVIAVFVGWAAYRLYGYINLHGFEWKQLLFLLTKDGMVKVIIKCLGAIQWLGCLLSIGWALIVTGTVIGKMAPDQSKKEHMLSHLRLAMLLLSIAMSVVLLIIGKTWLFYVPLIICFIASIGNSDDDDDDDDDKKAKELEEKNKELERLKQRVKELEKKLAEAAIHDGETE